MSEPIKLIVHGSTGSIGTQTLDVVKRLKGKKDFEVCALVCNNNADLMVEQILEFNPEYAVVVDAVSAEKVAKALRRSEKTVKTTVLSGESAATKVCGLISGGYVVVATSGFAGLAPTLEAINAKNTVAIANKEAFLTAGKLIMDASRRNGVEVLPIDSEPSAIWQSMEGDVFMDGRSNVHSAVWNLQRGADHDIKSIILTCSGGPFRSWDRDRMRDVTPEAALKHPNWDMGGLITIRSATLMNKGMERIEIAAIFNMSVDDINIVIHPQSIVHSGIELRDGSQKVQQGPHDMRYPIAFALTYPHRHDIGIPKLALTDAKNNRFDFEAPDLNRFPSIKLAYEAAKAGGTAPAVLNGADETAVDMFMRGKAGFLDMADLVGSALMNHSVIKNPSLEQIKEADRWSREHVMNSVMSIRRETQYTHQRSKTAH